jgi:HSP20 family protein
MAETHHKEHEAKTDRPAPTEDPRTAHSGSEGSAERRLASAGGGHPLSRLRSDMDRLFEDFLGRRWPALWGGPLVGATMERMPSYFGGAAGDGLIDVKMDIAETEDAIEITAEMPGVPEEDLDVELAGGVLTIRGEKKQSHEEKQKDFYRCERSYGSFQRAFGVPESVDAEKIEAMFDKGVLHVTLPKKAEAKAKAKKIPVGKT